MKLRRSKPTPPTRRQRLSRDEPAFAPPPAFSYGSRRSERPDGSKQRQSPTATQRTKRRRLPLQLPQLGRTYWLVSAGMLVLLVWIASLSTKPVVRPVGVNPTLVRDQSDYAATATHYLSGSLLSHNKITVDSAGLQKKLLQQYPELSEVSVTLPLLAHNPVIYIAPVPPALFLATSHGTFVVGNTGRVLLLADNLPKGKQLTIPTVTDNATPDTPQSNQQVLAASQVNFIQTLLAELHAKGVNPGAIELPAASSQLNVHIAGQPYYVKFNMQAASPQQQAGTFLATQSQLQKQSVTPTQYIDVRLNGRAYYQ